MCQLLRMYTAYVVLGYRLRNKSNTQQFLISALYCTSTKNSATTAFRSVLHPWQSAEWVISTIMVYFWHLGFVLFLLGNLDHFLKIKAAVTDNYQHSEADRWATCIETNL